MVRSPTSGQELQDGFRIKPYTKITLTDLTQRALQVMALGGSVHVLNHTGALAGWSWGRVPTESVPPVYVFVKHPCYSLWYQYSNSMRGGHNSSPADRRCVNPVPDNFDMPAKPVLNNQGEVQQRLKTAIRAYSAYMVEIIDANNQVVLAVPTNEISLRA